MIRTNNDIEQWHMALNGVLRRHPPMATFVKAIKDDAIKVAALGEQLAAGADPPPQLPVYAAVTRRIEACCRRYVNGQYGQGGDAAYAFLRGIAHNYLL